jgi:alpha-tubulin suppressor-like RCC1 family protein
LWCWGEGDKFQLGDGAASDRSAPVRVDADKKWAHVAAGQGHSCGIDTDGAAWCWGEGIAGQLGQGARVRGHVPVKVGGATP